MSRSFPEVRQLSKVALQILKKRYFIDDNEDWPKLVDRVVNYVMSTADDNERSNVERMILNRYVVPNSPCLVNAGKHDAGLCACYVVDFPDDIRGIYKTKLDFALIARKGGGCGTSLTKLRPEGAKVSGSTHGYAGGGINFADSISNDMDVISQGGFRSMAIMFTMSVYHPDIIKFITAKTEEGKISNANMSVMVDNLFMEQVLIDGHFWTEFDGVKYQQYKARDVFNMIAEGAWRNGEPGVLFQDRIDDSPYQYTGQEIFSTNPCSEQPLPVNGVCNIASIDISKFFNMEKKELNKRLLEKATRLTVRFLDAVVDKSSYPTEDIASWSRENRAIAVGIMGVADYFLMKELAYGSEESLEELDMVMEFISKVSYDESENLGEELGVPKMCQRLPIPRRNITVTTVAPTGTTSLIAGCSSGIEPIFSETTIRNDKTGTYKFKNNLANKPYFKCAVSLNGDVDKEVTWQEHIGIVSTVQKHVDSGVSKTINFPKLTRKDTIANAIMMAWENNCKGIAVYRNGSRKVEVLTTKEIK